MLNSQIHKEKFTVNALNERSFSTIEGFVQRGYFVFSFGFLLFRTIAVSIYAAWINDESKEPMHVLHSVQSSVYNQEVNKLFVKAVIYFEVCMKYFQIQRLLQQISFDNVALTGNKMYKVTKGLILNVDR